MSEIPQPVWDDVTESALMTLWQYRKLEGQGVSEDEACAYMERLGAFFYEEVEE